MQKQIIEDCIIFQHAPIVGHGGKHCILNHREDFVDFANSHDVEAVFAGHTHRNWKFGTNPEGQVKKITESNMDDPPDFATNTVPLDWYTVYIETGSSTKE